MSHTLTPHAPQVTDPVVSALVQYNQGRDPERLALKYAKMRQSPFIFLRGACHLFYPNLPATPSLISAPLAWACGDLHFENFGSYKGDDRQAYFDINDFDEAALAPCTWDLLRLLTSLQCGADELKASPAQARELSQHCVQAYREALLQGKPLWVQGSTATGLVAELFTRLQTRHRVDFLNSRTVLQAGQRQLRADGQKALPASEAQRERVTAFIHQYAQQQTLRPAGYFKVKDVARRIAGTGSLGLPRYVVLVEGKGGPDGHLLLDLKAAQSSSLAPVLATQGVRQPTWMDEAHRIVGVQQRVQAVNHAFLDAVHFDGQACVLRGLQPSEDRVSVGKGQQAKEHLPALAQTLGHLLAWDQLRAAGRSGSANADALIHFAEKTQWVDGLLEAAQHMVQTTQDQWKAFVSSPLGLTGTT
ncbi:DUF2252 domain-containing protein [Curvibacter sp. RS43]|uniref:DUF2252 domain-containing protein n=1 Tax=Curvibacter microcysteis TaxID=3026419 RepID=UPI00235E0F39|nr:DUF2252 domain-containing protein [Curvibacter sp. RS43]MDD0810498.1 DUF2252 domain-containing protein [Curvibacter sp. RS43]